MPTFSHSYQRTKHVSVYSVTFSTYSVVLLRLEKQAHAGTENQYTVILHALILLWEYHTGDSPVAGIADETQGCVHFRLSDISLQI